jgi:magnesium transporter
MSNFLKNTSSIRYSPTEINRVEPADISEVVFNNKGNCSWINTYGLNYLEDFNRIISQNSLDEFLLLLIKEN